MVVGKRPFSEDDLGALMQIHLREEIPDPKEAVSDIPQQLRQERYIGGCRQRATF